MNFLEGKKAPWRMTVLSAVPLLVSYLPCLPSWSNVSPSNLSTVLYFIAVSLYFTCKLSAKLLNNDSHKTMFFFHMLAIFFGDSFDSGVYKYLWMSGIIWMHGVLFLHCCSISTSDHATLCSVQLDGMVYSFGPCWFDHCEFIGNLLFLFFFFYSNLLWLRDWSCSKVTMIISHDYHL